MPALTTNLRKLFPSHIRDRGQAYFWRRAVQIDIGSAQLVEGVVRGSRTYQVHLDWDRGVLTLGCSCPYFETDGPCKHLWATVLAAEGNGYLTAVTYVRDVQEVTPGERPPDVEDTEFDPDEDALEFPRYRTPAPFPARPEPRGPAPAREPAAPRQPAWKAQLANLATEDRAAAGIYSIWPDKRQLLYLVDTAASVAAGHLVLALLTRDRKQNGEFARPASIHLQSGAVPFLPVPEDREVLFAMTGAREYYTSYGANFELVPTYNLIPDSLAVTLLPLALSTGRCFLRAGSASEHLTPLTLESSEGAEAAPWRFELALRVGGVRKPGNQEIWLLEGFLRRGDQKIDVSAPELVTPNWVFLNGKVAPLDAANAFPFLTHLRRTGSIQAPTEDRDDLLSTLLSTPGLPPLDVPKQLSFEQVTLAPKPAARIHADKRARLSLDLVFDYEGRLVPYLDPADGVYDAANRRFLRRDRASEAAAVNLLRELGVRQQPPTFYERDPTWSIASSKLSGVVRSLVEAGWHVEAEGQVYRSPGSFQMAVSSGVDWFELHGTVDYQGTTARLPELLDAVRRGKKTVRLGDGTYGVLPEEWLKRIGMLAGMGTPEDGHIRFRHSQAGLLDALLATQPEATFDAGFAHVRAELRQFQGVSAAKQPPGFCGKLRGYQREGVGWMEFLRKFSFGGCLADDMGVGKTPQVLALLEQRRELREAGQIQAPSLVVVPRSLIFNWKEEAARFTPRLRVLDYTGLGRGATNLTEYDLVLTTYGTLRRDAPKLKDVAFDYVVLDEAQAIKNAGTASSKAVRLLRGDHRLALSGTPVENHLGELWSLFEFLNPGMLGSASVFQFTSGAGRTLDEDTRTLLAQAVRPFILRRTKEQVARELPPKTEQTLYCELEPAQRKLYDELREHYRAALLKKIDTQGLGKSKIMVLEALLRLRQAACHPGLIDSKRAHEPSAKLEALEEQLSEMLDSGHKALVFSQFTSLLQLVRNRLDRENIPYEYLDGKTRDRQARVERFQNDPDCQLFLISLKAGGLGLNLTAAEYVFLLDPWWNPAVEAQAVDRAHRIGQQRAVFAYRLIARDTVEEKVLELQKSKRALAEAIIGENNALIRNLRREDLELLLS